MLLCYLGRNFHFILLHVDGIPMRKHNQDPMVPTRPRLKKNTYIYEKHKIFVSYLIKAKKITNYQNSLSFSCGKTTNCKTCTSMNPSKNLKKRWVILVCDIGYGVISRSGKQDKRLDLQYALSNIKISFSHNLQVTKFLMDSYNQRFGKIDCKLSNTSLRVEIPAL